MTSKWLIKHKSAKLFERQSVQQHLFHISNMGLIILIDPCNFASSAMNKWKNSSSFQDSGRTWRLLHTRKQCLCLLNAMSPTTMRMQWWHDITSPWKPEEEIKTHLTFLFLTTDQSPALNDKHFAPSKASQRNLHPFEHDLLTSRISGQQQKSERVTWKDWKMEACMVFAAAKSFLKPWRLMIQIHFQNGNVIFGPFCFLHVTQLHQWILWISRKPKIWLWDECESSDYAVNIVWPPLI